MDRRCLVVTTTDRPGTLASVTRAIAHRQGDIRTIESLGPRRAGFSVYLEIEAPEAEFDPMRAEILSVPDVLDVEDHESIAAIFGKRVIIIGGGAQVGQVAIGAAGEADRHNIRGERISVDTIPLVGEEDLANAVAAVARLPRAQVLVLAGALMGGSIADAVRELRETTGILVISLNMAGSVPSASDLVVGDPVMAGVMAVMAIANTAKFDLPRLRGHQF